MECYNEAVGSVLVPIVVARIMDAAPVTRARLRRAVEATPEVVDPWTGNRVRQGTLRWQALLRDRYVAVNIQDDGRISLRPAPVDLSDRDAARDLHQMISAESRWNRNYPVYLKLTSNIVDNTELIREFTTRRHMERFLSGIFLRPDDYKPEEWYEMVPGADLTDAAIRTQLRMVWRSTQVALWNGDHFLGGCSGTRTRVVTRNVGPVKLWIRMYNVGNNNCGLRAVTHVLGLQVRCDTLRVRFGFPSCAPLSTEDVLRVYEGLRGDDQKPLFFIDKNYTGPIRMEYAHYVWMSLARVDGTMHYAPVVRVAGGFDADSDLERTNHGEMVFDFETRLRNTQWSEETCDYVDPKLRDTICGVVWRRYKAVTDQSRVFVSTPERSSARQFLDFLHEEMQQGRSYHINAFNGSRHVCRVGLCLRGIGQLG